MKLQITYRSLWGISLPIMVALLHETILDVASTAFLARYGITELGAVAIGDAIYDVAAFAALGLSEGIQIMVARRAGQGKRRAIGKIVNQGLALVGLLSVLLCLVIRYVGPLVTPIFIDSPAVCASVNDFLGISCFAVIFHSMNVGLAGFFTGIGKPRALAWATALLAVVNITLDYALILGHLGAPRLGIRGAAIAALASEAAVFLFLIGVARYNRELSTFGLFKLEPWSRPLTRKLLRVSTPIALETLLLAMHWVVFFAIVEERGQQALGAANIVQECYALLAIPILGFADATCTLVSNVVGQGRAHQIRVILRRATGSAYLFAVPLAALAFAWPDPLLAIFTEDEALCDASAAGLQVLAISLLAVAPGQMLSAAIAGTGDTRADLWHRLLFVSSALLFAWIVAIALELPPELVWLSEGVGWLLCALPAATRLAREEWRKLAV